MRVNHKVPGFQMLVVCVAFGVPSGYLFHILFCGSIKHTVNTAITAEASAVVKRTDSANTLASLPK